MGGGRAGAHYSSKKKAVRVVSLAAPCNYDHVVWCITINERFCLIKSRRYPFDQWRKAVTMIQQARAVRIRRLTQYCCIGVHGSMF